MLKLWEESKTFWPVVEENMEIQKKNLKGKEKATSMILEQHGI